MVPCGPVMAPRDIDSLIASIVEEGARLWPQFRVDRAQFAAHLASLRVESDAHAGDLSLAFACAQRDPAALVEFGRRLVPLIREALRTLKLTADEMDELSQELVIRLCIGDMGRSPSLSQYRGDGPLEGWIRQVVRRAAIDFWRKQGSSPERLPSQSIDRLSEAMVNATEMDALLGGLDHEPRAQARAAFPRFFKEAIAGLEPGDRNLMWMNLVEKVPMRALCEIAGVTDRSSVSRRLEALRERVRDSVRRRMEADLGTTASEFYSVLDSMMAHFPEALER
jgi:RNA polymerase sigma-70 factor, ECF subfamily